jgi:hypothetical protein
VHIPGISEYRTIATVVAHENGHWTIEDDEGRTMYVPENTDADIRVGDRVEVEPTTQGAVLRPHNWVIVRKIR